MESEKENFVVIVPENILQAIKNSSNLSIDIADALNVTNVSQKEDSSESSDFTNIANGNMLLWLPSDTIGINTEIPVPVVGNSESECNLAFRSYSVVDDSGNVALTSAASSSQILLHSDSATKPQPISEVILPTSSDITLSVSSSTQNSVAKSLNIPPQVVEGNRDTSIHVNPSNSSAENYFVINSSVIQSTTTTSATTASFPAKITSRGKQSVIVSPPLLSHQEIVKQTADKATYVNGVKTLHKCDVDNCNQMFKSLRECRKHKTTVHGKEKMYKCKYANCLWSFSTPYKLRRHLESHYKRKPYSCTYPGCNAVFSSDYNQRAHMRLHTTIKPSRICKICGKISANKQDLSVHLRKVHNQAPEFLCNICKNNFYTLAALVIHKRSHYPRNDFECPICEKKFTSRYNLKIHLYTHTGEKPYKCEQCDCGFASLSRLNRHSWIHKDRRFECTEEKCEKKFYRLQHLMQHMRKNHGIEPCTKNSALQMYLNKSSTDNECSKYYACEPCGLRCLTSHGLERHKRKCESYKIRMAESLEDDLVLESNPDEEPDLLDLDNDFTVNQNENIIVEIDSYNDDVSKDDDCPSNNNEGNLNDENQKAVDLNSDCLLTNASEPPPKSSVDIVVDLATNWNSSPIESSNVNETANPSMYLACSPAPSNEPAFQVPLMDGMDVLQDPTTQKFLQQNETIPTCTDDPVEQTPEQDVLEQYVISTHDLNNMITTTGKDENPLPSNADNPAVNQPASSAALFEDNIPLVPMENGTINIDDINWFVLYNRASKGLP